MTEVVNPLINKMNKKHPGETFRLPSRGKKYKNGELSDDVQNGEILVQPMSTLDEIYFRTPDMLFQGTAAKRVIERCVPQVKSVGALLSKDVDYILSCLRKITYGEQLTVEYNHECKGEKSKKYDYILNISNLLKDSKEIDTDDSEMEFEIDDFYIKTKFITYDESHAIEQGFSDSENPDEIFTSFVNNLSANIISIDDIVDVEMIREFISTSPRSFQMDLAQKIQKLNSWGIDFTQEITCKQCNEIVRIPVMINPINFFTQPSEVEIPNA